MKYIYWPVTVTCAKAQNDEPETHPMEAYLQPTALLNFTHARLKDLVDRRGWPSLTAQQQINKIFDFVKNDIAFGFNKASNLPASRVLQDGYGCCNSKTTLLMALLRICHIPCRFHGVSIDKRRYEKVVAGIDYYWLPKNIICSWVEIYVQFKWLKLTGYMFDDLCQQSIGIPNGQVDDKYFDLNLSMPMCKQSAITGQDMNRNQPILGIHRDYGVFDSPDAFYQRHYPNKSFFNSWLFQYLARNRINHKLSQIRQDHSGKDRAFTVNRADR